MSKITFYTHVTNREHFAYKLIKTVLSRKQKLLVWLPDFGSLQQLDQFLWSFEAESFIPHGIITDSVAHSEQPVVLGCSELCRGLSLSGVVLNLSNEYIYHIGQFDRGLEIVGADEFQLTQAEARFQKYCQNSFEIEYYSMEGKS